MGYIYRIKNKITGWQYIGMTTRTPEIRYAQHLKDSKEESKSFIHWAIRTYGEDNFELATLFKHPTMEEEELQNVEILHIAKYNTYHGDGYNMHIGGKIEFNHGCLNLYVPCFDVEKFCEVKKVTRKEYKDNITRYLSIHKMGFYIYCGSRYRDSADLNFKLSQGALHRRCVTDNMYYLTNSAFSKNKEPYIQAEITKHVADKKRWCDLGWGFKSIQDWL